MATVKEVYDGIWQLILKQPNYGSVNCYVIKSEIFTLIDAGHNSTITLLDLIDGLAQLNLQLQDIDQIIITHSHIDHYGGIISPFANINAKIFAYKGVQKVINQIENYINLWRNIPNELIKHCPEYQDVIKENSSIYKSYFYAKDAFTIDVEVKHGDVIDIGNEELYVVFSPGHSPDHMCLFQKSTGILFSGDLILESGPALVSLTNDDVDNYLYSLEKIRKLPVKMLLPGHGSISFQPKVQIIRAKKRIEKQMVQVSHAIKEGALTISEIVAKLEKNKDLSTLTVWISIILTYVMRLEKLNQVKLFRNKEGGISKILYFEG